MLRLRFGLRAGAGAGAPRLDFPAGMRGVVVVIDPLFHVAIIYSPSSLETKAGEVKNFLLRCKSGFADARWLHD